MKKSDLAELARLGGLTVDGSETIAELAEALRYLVTSESVRAGK